MQGTVERTLKLLFIAVPLYSLAYMAFNWLKWGVDLPFYDDWGSYLDSEIGSLSLSHLFKSANDTLFPVGRFLDALAQRALNGNSVAYQLISMLAVLGACLWFQWKLLRAVVRDDFLAASAFLASVFMLQPGSYWGDPNRAYHQALPVVCLLASLYVILLVRSSSFVKLPLLFVLGLISGLSYTSGAFSMLAAAIVLVAFGLILPNRPSFVSGGIALGIAGLITSSMQAWVLIVVQGGQTHRPDAPWATPLDADFWLYVMGKIARSLSLPSDMPAVSLVVVLLAIAVAAVVISRQAYRVLSRQEGDQKEVDRLCVTLFLLAAIGTYLAMVAAGRTNLRDALIDTPLEVFVSGFPRFHFFWITLFWPWAIAALLVGARERYGRQIAALLASLLAVAIVGFGMQSGSFRHGTYFSIVNHYRADHIACLQERLLTSDRLVCPGYPHDLTPAYAFAVGTQPSFMKYIQPALRRFNTSPALQIFDLRHAAPAALVVENAQILSRSDNRIELAARDDAAIVLSAENPAVLDNCLMLMLRATITGQAGEAAELFYVPKGRTHFSPEFRAQSGAGQPVEIIASSWTGFNNVLRLHPVRSAGRISVADLTVRCLVLRS